MANDLHERVARLLMGGTYSDEQAATQIAMAQYGAKAAVVIPAILEEAAKIMEKHVTCCPDCFYSSAAAMRALGAAEMTRRDELRALAERLRGWARDIHHGRRIYGADQDLMDAADALTEAAAQAQEETKP